MYMCEFCTYLRVSFSVPPHHRIVGARAGWLRDKLARPRVLVAGISAIFLQLAYAESLFRRDFRRYAVAANQKTQVADVFLRQRIFFFIIFSLGIIGMSEPAQLSCS
jgi:hypothetical protein